MGFIKAFTGALSGSFANQWLEYMAPPASMRDHVLLARATPVKVNGSENNDGEENASVISDGSKFMVPEGTCLITVENGGITAVIAEPGGYTYTTQNVPEAKSMFAGDGFFASTFGQSWNQFKFGGQPGNQQQAYYVNLKDVAGLRYGTQNVIRYKDSNYRGLMLSVTSNGTYTIKVVDPILLFKNLVPVDIVSGQGRGIFELGGEGDTGGVEDSLFSGFVGSLAAALSAYTKGGKSIDDIQGGTVEFAKNVNEAVEANFQWGTKYGLEVVNVQPLGLDWDEKSAQMVEQFNATMLSGMAQAQTMGMVGEEMAKDGGRIGAAYSQATIARGFEAAGNNQGGNGGTTGMFGMGMAINQMGGAGSLTTPIGGGEAATPAAAPAPAAPAAPAEQAAAPAEPAAPETPAEPETPAAA
jgi:membrane protease subunit (stomatin/prohibitin family)